MDMLESTTIKSGSLISPYVAIELDCCVGYFDLLVDKGTRFSIMTEVGLGPKRPALPHTVNIGQ